MQISDQINSIRDKYITYATNQRITKHPQSLFDPINYIMSIGGKRLRPVLLLVVCNMYKRDINQVLSSAFAFELFHNFSLVHDDIMDKADLRRKQPTVHKKFGDNTAILAGDMMLIQVYDYLLKSGENPKKVIEIFNKVATLVCEGQQCDMDFEVRDDVTLDEYISMISGKTAALIGGALEVGAYLGGASKDACSNWYNFGFNLGIAFQMRDDILDTYGDEASFGKRIGGDIIEDKNTILMVLARKKASSDLLNKISETKNLKDNEKILSVTNIFNELDVQNIAIEIEETYFNRAKKYLEEIDLDTKTKAPILDMAESLMKRNV